MIEQTMPMVQTINAQLLAEPVRQAQHDPTFHVLDWTVQPLAHEKIIDTTGGLFLFSGTGSGSAGTASWSIVLKVLNRPEDGHPKHGPGRIGSVRYSPSNRGCWHSYLHRSERLAAMACWIGNRMPGSGWNRFARQPGDAGLWMTFIALRTLRVASAPPTSLDIHYPRRAGSVLRFSAASWAMAIGGPISWTRHHLPTPGKTHLSRAHSTIRHGRR